MPGTCDSTSLACFCIYISTVCRKSECIIDSVCVCHDKGVRDMSHSLAIVADCNHGTEFGEIAWVVSGIYKRAHRNREAGMTIFWINMRNRAIGASDVLSVAHRSVVIVK